MSSSVERLADELKARFGDALESVTIANGEVTVEIPPEKLLEVAEALASEPSFAFEQVVDVCGVDYLDYGSSEWATEESSTEGYSRGVESHSTGRLRFGEELEPERTEKRFAAVYHLLSYQHNRRLRIRVFARDEQMPVVPSVTHIWSGVDWFEREAFDLYGILFEGHPDLRRILTDYGFLGHPFRKDFPLVGQVEMRYDPEKQRVVYEPVSIEPRVLVPKVVRHDNRYAGRNQEEA